MSGLTCQQIVFACAERKSQRGLWLGVNAQQLVARCPCVSEGVEQPAYIKGSDPPWSLQHRDHPAEFGSFVAILNRPGTAGRWRLALVGCGRMTKEAALLLFNLVPVTVSTICRISFVCA
jgi:hypothetical protein